MTEEDGPDSNGLLIPKTDFLYALQYCDLPCPDTPFCLVANEIRGEIIGLPLSFETISCWNYPVTNLHRPKPVSLNMLEPIKPKPAYGRQGLDWIVRPGYSFGVFSTSRFAPPALSSVDDLNWPRRKKVFAITTLNGSRGGNKQKYRLFRHSRPNWPFRG